nr:RNA polymerase beta subunit protein a [Elakatothrix viridis]
MFNYQYSQYDLIQIQRQSFLYLLEKGIIEEIQKRNPITNEKKDLEIIFHPEYYQLSNPELNPYEAILNSKTYCSKMYIPVQLVNRKAKKIIFKWIYLGDLPLMTKRGHFIFNGLARVVINQIIRSPGIYYQEKIYEIYPDKWSEKPSQILHRYYADLICLRGTWLRIEMDKKKLVWAKMKKGPKLPIWWLLIAMGLNERIVLKAIKKPKYYWKNLNVNYELLSNGLFSNFNLEEDYEYVENEYQSWKEISLLVYKNSNKKILLGMGRKWLFKKFLNSRNYDLGKQGRICFNKKLGANISLDHLTLTAQDLMLATEYLLQLEQGLKNIDDIDHLKNRRVRTSGELIQIQLGVGLIRLEKFIREKLELTYNNIKSTSQNSGTFLDNRSTMMGLNDNELISLNSPLSSSLRTNYRSNSQDSLKLKVKSEMITRQQNNISTSDFPTSDFPTSDFKRQTLNIQDFINTKFLNGTFKEFFGLSPLSQFMDQINPLAEITHKRRLSSLGPGGVTRDTATLNIRGIHPSHYGRICPIETPEGKNTGLVNSFTIYSKLNWQGLIETPFYKVYQGQVQKDLGIFFLSADKEEQVKVASSDVKLSKVGFLPKVPLSSKKQENFITIFRNQTEYIGISPIQMISIATSIIPFLEHDDANRALMGSNMQRQAVPLIRPEKPIVLTGLEAKTVSDSGQALQAKFSGLVTYVSSKKIVIQTFF